MLGVGAQLYRTFQSQKLNQIFLFFLFFYFSCSLPATEKKANVDNLSLFIIPESKDSFQLIIDDKVKFNTIRLNKETHGPQELITEIAKSADSIKLNLKIGDRDTLFNISTAHNDSLIFGLDLQRHFIVMNQNQYIWYYD